MYAQAAIKPNTLLRNGAYGIVMRGMQKCTCAGASLRGRNSAPLCCIKLDTATDMTMGTSQMLSCMEERIHDLNAEIEVTCFGQEFNPSTFAIAKADMMIRGGDPNNMRFGDTLSDDQFKGYTFQYCISNPPFGIDWKREQKAVEAENKLGELGRFAPGLPKISDGQQLFVLNGLSKLAPNGKMAIIQNGSPLFSGDAESGPSEIRRYILEHDWLDAIVQLSTDQFMNTGISTYIWVCSKDKPAYRAGKVQLIDASHCYEPRRKSIGTKRNDITDLCRNLIVQAYGEFRDGAIYGDKDGVYCQSKIFNTEDFGYYKIVVERPTLDEAGKPVLKKGKPVADTSLRDTENVPMTEDIDEYFRREVLPYAPDAWIDTKKTKVGYEIPMTRYFYEYQAPEPVEDIMARISQRILRFTTILLPPIDEQIRIADYLDAKCARIDAVIEQTRSSIDEYGRLKQSVIAQAVTKGVRPNRTLKPSGIEWVKVLPDDWTVIPAKFLFRNSDTRKQDGDEQMTASQQYGIITQERYMELTGSKVVFANKGLEDWKHVEPFDFVISLRSFQGGLEMSETTGCITWHYIVLKPCKEVYSYYYKWLFKSELYIKALQRTCNFIRDEQDLRYSNFIQVPLFEPSLDEQKEIAEYLNKKCAEIDELITQKERLLAELETYKKSLIYEYVTGKKEV